MRKYINTYHSHLFFIIIFFYIFIFNILQSSIQHWTSVLDQDTVIIYNTLLVISGYNQEYRDHPGYTYFFFLGIIYKIFSFLYSNNIFNIDEIIKEPQINHYNFQILFYIARLLNSFVLFLIFVYYFKISRIFKITPKIIYLSIIIILSSYSFFKVNFYLRNEGFSLLFFLISFLQILKFFKKGKYKFIFYAGFFFTFSMLAKIQIIILFMLPFLIIPILIKINNLKKKLIKFEKIFIIQNFLFLLFYLLFQTSIIFFSTGDHKFFYDLMFFAVFFILYLVYTKKFLKLGKENFLILNNIFALFVLGVFFSLIFLKIIDILNIIKLSNYVILRLTNPISYLIVFTDIHEVTKIGNVSLISQTFLLKILNKMYLIFRSLYFSEVIFLVFVIIIPIFFLIKFKNKNSQKKIIPIIFLLYITVLISSNILRGPYFFYILIIGTIFLNIFSIDFSYNIVKILNVSLVMIFLLDAFISKNINVFFDVKNNSELICKDTDTREYMKYWHNKFDEMFLNKFCK